MFYQVYHYIVGGRIGQAFPKFPFPHRKRRSIPDDATQDPGDAHSIIDNLLEKAGGKTATKANFLSALFKSSPSALLKLLPFANPDLMATGVQQLIKVWLAENAATTFGNDAKKQELFQIVSDIAASTGADDSDVQHAVLATIIKR